jgi:hypothetical protein
MTTFLKVERVPKSADNQVLEENQPSPLHRCKRDHLSLEDANNLGISVLVFLRKLEGRTPYLLLKA